MIFQDLLAAVDKINSSLSKKAKGSNFFRQDEIPSLNLGGHILLKLFCHCLSDFTQYPYILYNSFFFDHIYII